MLRLISCDRETYLANLGHPKTGQPGYEPYNLNPLLKWPLIQISDEEYLAPHPRDLMERASSGIYYDLMPADRGRFGAVLGAAFQEYVGLILQGLPGVPQLRPEIRYTDNRTPKVTCDWIVVDGDTAVLIECKLSAVSALAKVTGDRSQIKSSLSSAHGVVDGVLKLYETEQAAMNQCPGLELLADVRRFYGVVVVLDDFYMPNSPLVRESVGEALKERGTILENRIQFAHVGGIEWLANLLKRSGTSITAVMDAKTATSAHVEFDLKNFVPAYARQFLSGEEITPWMPYFDEVYEQFMSDVVPRLQVRQTKTT